VGEPKFAPKQMETLGSRSCLLFPFQRLSVVIMLAGKQRMRGKKELA